MLLAITAAIPLGAAPAFGGATTALSGSSLYVNPLSTTLEAAQSLSGTPRAEAQLIGSISSAEWLTKGTPTEVKAAAKKYVDAATAAGKMPVLVAYNLPFRDCAQYSAGGAADSAAYAAWISAVAAGIGSRAATVILEPDGLGIIPHYTTIDGVHEWCQPAELDAATAADERFAQVSGAIDTLKAGASTSVYLDAGHSAWLNVGDITSRLVRAGVERADGFFLNASNYQYTANLTAYGHWISSCIAYVTQKVAGDYGSCGNQYWNGGPANSWTGVAMSNYGQWSADNADPALNTAGVDSRYASILGDLQPSTHFVIDTSRNGAGPWQAPSGTYSDAEDWCNPPGRGLGAQPTTSTGDPLVDAYLWIKVPGESDGQCYRGTGGPLDPARGVADPAAGSWFAAQAHELLTLAVPALAPLTCDVTVKGTQVGPGFAAAITVQNKGTATLKPWTLSWVFGATQKVSAVVGGSYGQTGPAVTVTAPKLLPTLAPGKKAAFAVIGRGQAQQPWQFRLNGQACTSH